MIPFADRDDISTERIGEVMKHDWFHTVFLRGTSTEKNSHTSLFVKNMTKMLRRLVPLCGIEDTMFRP